MNSKISGACTALLMVGLTSPASAEQSSWVSTGLTWTQDLAAQTALMQPLSDTTLQSRSGFETAAGANWSRLDHRGGYSLGFQGLYDRGFDSDTDISEAGLSASTMRSLSTQWLAKLTLYGALYRNQAFRSSSYDALGTEATLGYFGNNANGLDLKLGWTDENHNQDPNNDYRTRRSYTEAIWYLPHSKNALRWNLSTRFQSNNANDPRFDYRSIQFKAGFKHWKIGNSLGAVSLQWQRDNYDNPMLFSSPQPGFNPQADRPNRMDQGNMVSQGIPASTPEQKKRKDTLYFATLEISHALSKKWQLSLSADAGRYQSDPRNTDRQFYDLALTSTWVFN